MADRDNKTKGREERETQTEADKNNQKEKQISEKGGTKIIREVDTNAQREKGGNEREKSKE